MVNTFIVFRKNDGKVLTKFVRAGARKFVQAATPSPVATPVTTAVMTIIYLCVVSNTGAYFRTNQLL
jgi:hypothetical protein